MANDIIDLTTEAATIAQAPADEDRLTKLPSELLHNVFDYLFVRHQPDELRYHSPRRDEYGPRCGHELDMLAATCRILRSEINDWATHFLVQHQDITRYKPPKQLTNKNKTFNALRARGGQGLLSWADRHCIVCGKISTRAAILVNGLKCCKACDAKHWPKITKSAACKEYYLKDYHLLPPRLSGLRYMVEVEARFRHGIPRIHYGTYDAMGVTAKAFLRKDVEWLARLYHGDLEAHLGERKARLENQRQRRKDKAMVKAAAEEVAAAKAREERKGPVVGTSANGAFVLDDDEDDFDD